MWLRPSQQFVYQCFRKRRSKWKSRRLNIKPSGFICTDGHSKNKTRDKKAENLRTPTTRLACRGSRLVEVTGLDGVRFALPSRQRLKLAPPMAGSRPDTTQKKTSKSQK